MTLPAGMFVHNNLLIDHSPRVVRQDVVRELKRLTWLTDEDRDRLTVRLIAAAEARALCVSPGKDDQIDKTPTIVSRIAGDLTRLLVIESLAESHVAPGDVRDASRPARSRLIRSMELYDVHPIDTVAVRVAHKGGSDDE